MLYAIVVVLLLIADQGLKYWATVHVPLEQGRHALIPKLLDITNIHNYGIAFSWLQNVPSWIFAVIAALFAVVVILALRRGMIRGKFGRWMAVLALAGAIGNCIDRVLSGYVVDMLAFAFWKSFPVFNFADACLVVGGIAFCLYVIFHKEEDDAEARAKKPARKRASADQQTQKPAAPRAEKRPEREARPQQTQKPAAVKPAVQEASAKANDDPFAAWDRAVAEQDAREKAAQERKAAREAAYRAEKEARHKAELAAKQKAEKAEPKPEPKPEPAKPAVDSAPTIKVAAQKIEALASKLAAAKPAKSAEPAKPAKPAEPVKPAKPAEAPKPAEEPVSYDLEDILREFADL